MTIKQITSFFISLSLILGFASCNIINPDEKIPCYIKIDTSMVTTSTNYATQGSAKQKIKDVWAYIDGNLVGVYELPALFPVIGDAGKHSFLFAPGIYDNGIASTHIIYRLMQGPEMDISLINGATVSPTSKLVFSYFPEITFSWIEDFENGSNSLAHISGDTLVRDNADPIEGYYGKITLNTSDPSFRFQMPDWVSIAPTSVTYLEMNYKCDQPFLVGLVGEKINGNLEAQVIYINPSATWNKIYVSLGTGVRALNPALGYKLFFGSTLGLGVQSGTFYFDNLKLLHN